MSTECIFEGIVIGIVSGLILSFVSWRIEERKDKRERKNNLYGKIIEWCDVNRSERLSEKVNRFEATICPYRNDASKEVKKKINEYCVRVKRVKKEIKDGYDYKPEIKKDKNYGSFNGCNEAEKEICELINKECLETKPDIFSRLWKWMINNNLLF